MATIEQNIEVFNETYNWEKHGEEWSHLWGGSLNQWTKCIYPRISQYLPVKTTLEIGPGFGRWIRFLNAYCNNLIGVDLSEKCIDYCKEQFQDTVFYLNNGQSLDMIEDNSIDFVFSFDSLVHTEDSILKTYVLQIAKKLTKNGVSFLHHSNLGAYSETSEDTTKQWRDPTMSAEKMQQYANEAGLKVTKQELITWNTEKTLIDCFSTLAREGELEDLQNFNFMYEAERIKKSLN